MHVIAMLPPVPVCATLTTPLVNAGGKDVYRIGTARHCPNSPTNSQFVALLRKADNHKTLIELIQLLSHVVEGNGELPPFLAGKVGAHVGETPPAVAVELGIRRFQFLP